MDIKSNKIEFIDFRYVMKDERYVFQPSVTNWSKLSLACKFSFRFKNINFTMRIILPPVSENIFGDIKL